MKINVTIFGVSGYTGSQLLSILSNHKNVKIRSVFGSKSSGKSLKKLFPNFSNIPDLIIGDESEYDQEHSDITFLCLPNTKSQYLIKKYKFTKIIDLSADFRIENIESYKNWYDLEHILPEKLTEFTYGLTELNRTNISKTDYVANPGCYPTSVLIPLIPLLKENIIPDIDHIIIDSKSGLSGAGKSLKENNLFSEVNENFSVYNVEKHRHLGEIKQELGKYKKDLKVTFTPHLLPITRGILSTIYVKKNGIELSKINRFFNNYFKDEPFIKFDKNNGYPDTKSVRGTNNLNFKVYEDYDSSQIIIVSCIDNIIKGAAGQAVQNMNVMFGINELESLLFTKIEP